MDIRQLAQISPSARQLAWQRMEFYGFVHFGMNTFTDREWGDGTDSPALFNPTDLNPDSWVAAMKDAGMTGLILTCKHHDGFCLWPSQWTDYSVASSPWMDGKGDVVALTAAACARAGLRFGIYLSPWDRHEPTYGSGEAYNTYYLRQLEELLTRYGPLFCVWFDGACGEGPNGKVQQYDWDAYYACIRRHQPDACICICGPDVRWCGNEAGKARPSEWSVVPASLRNAEKTQEISQHEDDPSFSRTFRSNMQDLGSRDAIAGVVDLCWYPAEVDTSIRPGWFHHASQDDAVRSADTLFSIYCNSVGGNSTLLLNIPPDRSGNFAQPDRIALHELGQKIRALSATPLHASAHISADVSAPQCDADRAISKDPNVYWAAPAGTESATLEMRWDTPQDVASVVLQEAISQGQRIEDYTLLYENADGNWDIYGSGSVIGYKKILLGNVRTCALRLQITASRWQPTLQSFFVYSSNISHIKEI